MADHISGDFSRISKYFLDKKIVETVKSFQFEGCAVEL
jgi:hypothetical protein